MSMSRAAWQQLANFLDADCAFKATPPGTAVGAKLLSAISSLDDLHKVRLSRKRIWARISDPSTRKRSLSAASKNFLHFWKAWCLRPQMHSPLGQACLSTDAALAADACGHGSHIGIGGWIEFPSQPIIWFSECFDVRDFQKRDVPVKHSANLGIVCYETLAQVALVAAFASACRGGRLRVKIPSWSDNSGTEAVCGKLFTTHQPLARIVQVLALHAWHAAVRLDVSHIAGCHNQRADFLSR